MKTSFEAISFRRKKIRQFLVGSPLPASNNELPLKLPSRSMNREKIDPGRQVPDVDFVGRTGLPFAIYNPFPDIIKH